MIRVTKQGYLIPTKILKETKNYYHVIDLPKEENYIMKIHKKDKRSKLFKHTSEALEWLGINL